MQRIDQKIIEFAIILAAHKMVSLKVVNPIIVIFVTFPADFYIPITFVTFPADY